MKHYEIRYTTKEAHDSGKTWTRNCEAHVACDTLERALELTRARHPNAVFISVICRNSSVDLIVDDQ